MKKSVIVVGVGEIGSVFSRGFLRCGYPVVPVTRNMNMTEVSTEIPDPELAAKAIDRIILPILNLGTGAKDESLPGTPLEHIL